MKRSNVDDPLVVFIKLIRGDHGIVRPGETLKSARIVFEDLLHAFHNVRTLFNEAYCAKP